MLSLSLPVGNQITIPCPAHRLVSHRPAGFTPVMTKRIGSHDPSIALTEDPARHSGVFAAAFNTGDPAAVEGVYEDLGVLVREPGMPVTGTDRKAANAQLLRLGMPIDVRPRHVYVADDIALLIVDWSITGNGPDGAQVDLRGTATDVARRGPDGKWRYLIDNPFGTS
jgi:ketosteroid isomerase-like protein